MDEINWKAEFDEMWDKLRRGELYMSYRCDRCGQEFKTGNGGQPLRCPACGGTATRVEGITARTENDP